MNADKLYEDALVAYGKGAWEDALELFEHAIFANERHVGAWHMRGLVEDKLGRPFNALMHLTQALSLEQTQALWCNRGVITGKLNQLEEAEECFLNALKYGSAYEPHQNLGDLYIRLMRLEDAKKQYEKAIECNPRDHGAHENLGRVQIALGDWKTGYREMYWRHKGPLTCITRQYYKAWDGQNLFDRTIFVYPEGGLGDEILDLRYALALRDKYPQAKVILGARPATYRIIKNSLQGRNITVIPQYDEPPTKVDVCVGISDLPQFLHINPTNIPYKKGYLVPQFGPPFDLPKGLKVGLCWLSGKRPLQKWTDRIQKAKSIPLSALSPLFEHKQAVTFISLQLDRSDPTVMRRLNLVNPMDQVEDLGDTARLMQQLDLIISVDTSVPHLAGACGFPVWNLVRFDEITTYPGALKFYDSMTFYRQTSPLSWDETLQKLFTDFDKWVNEHDTQREAAE